MCVREPHNAVDQDALYLQKSELLRDIYHESYHECVRSFCGMIVCGRRYSIDSSQYV